MEDLGIFADQRRAGDLAAALMVGDHVMPAGAGPEQAPAAGIRRAAASSQTIGPSAETRNGQVVDGSDGEASRDPVAWPGPTLNDLGQAGPLQLPPAPITASPAGWDGEPWAHAPAGTHTY